eukprot:NODE_29373_length_200_cov_2.046358_g28203_i0.p2 GENE.NODE_29373_length_200_cov_2.046358_g28203_i0~~NODE_29373_length_200_cov_2.046358_g28203_i0.p2  ORF type:complete len:51 (+),score=4.15 NODE_29373_length_200_cov_2.046358_g28203_i0:35-187(+)
MNFPPFGRDAAFGRMRAFGPRRPASQVWGSGPPGRPKLPFGQLGANLAFS